MVSSIAEIQGHKFRYSGLWAIIIIIIIIITLIVLCRI